jgi:hypothetical protein
MAVPCGLSCASPRLRSLHPIAAACLPAEAWWLYHSTRGLGKPTGRDPESRRPSVDSGPLTKPGATASRFTVPFSVPPSSAISIDSQTLGEPTGSRSHARQHGARLRGHTSGADTAALPCPSLHESAVSSRLSRGGTEPCPSVPLNTPQSLFAPDRATLGRFPLGTDSTDNRLPHTSETPAGAEGSRPQALDRRGSSQLAAS